MPYFKLDSHRLYYQPHNPRGLLSRPLVLLHGLGSSGEDWLLQQSYFSGDFPILTVDLRGHGRSSMGSDWPTMRDFADDVAALLEATDHKPAHLLGLSLGGAVALQLALDFPELVKSLTIVNAFARFRVNRQGWIRTIGRMDWLGVWIAAGIFPDPEQKAWREAAAARLADNSRNRNMRTIGAVIRFDAASRLKEVRAPTLIIAGERDMTVALEAKQQMAETIPGASMVTFPDSGHGTPYDAAEPLNKVVMDFLMDVEATRAQGR